MTSLAIITGASKGIGLACARRFLQDSWDVINVSRTPCPEKTVKNYECDLSDSRQVHRIFEAIDIKKYEKISLVHNAAITRKDNYETLDEDAFTQMFRVNVLAPQLINKIMLPQFNKGSSVIFMGSTLSDIGVPDNLSYVATKHALAGIMKATTHDLAGKDIHTCLVCPGFTDTEMLREVMGPAEKNRDFIKDAVLFGRLIEPDEIARLVFFCAENPVINGAVLHANLGQR